MTTRAADKPLRFAVMVGSLRRRSLNGIVADALPALAPADVSVERLGSVGDIVPYDADVQSAGFPEPVLEMAGRISACDALVIVTPEYNYSMPGTLKNALDWLSRLQPQPLARKPVAIQSASPGPIGGARVQYHLRQSLVFMDAYALNKPEVFIGGASGKIDVDSRSITDAAVIEKLKEQMVALAAMVRTVRS